MKFAMKTHSRVLRYLRSPFRGGGGFALVATIPRGPGNPTPRARPRRLTGPDNKRKR